MNLFNNIFLWCAGKNGSHHSNARINVYIFAGISILSFSLLIGFLSALTVFDYLSELPERANQVHSPFTVDSRLPRMDDSTSAEAINQVSENSAEETKVAPSVLFLNSSAGWLSILSGILILLSVFLFLRFLSSIDDKIKKLHHFLWWCAGANIKLLEECPTDHAKFYGIGGTIVFTALMASFAGGYAFFTAFHNIPFAVFFGIFWGALIFNLDRYIVSSTGIGDGTTKITKDEWISASPRLVLALIIGFVISTPLELKIFEKEINVEMQKMINEERSNIKGGLTDIHFEIQERKNRISELDQELEKNKSGVKGEDVLLESDNKDLDQVRQELAKLKRLKDTATSNYVNARNSAQQYKSLVEQRINTEENRRKQRSEELRRAGFEKQVSDYKSKIQAAESREREIIRSIAARGKKLKENLLSTEDMVINEKSRINTEIKELERKLAAKNTEADEVSTQFNGLMARLIALDRLSVKTDTIYVMEPVVNTMQVPSYSAVAEGESISNSPGENLGENTVMSAMKSSQIAEIDASWTPVFYAKWLIALLIICIEIAPILFKMMTEAGVYDDRLAEIAYQSEVQKKKYISDVNEKINTELKISNNHNNHKIVAELKANQDLVNAIANAQAEIAIVAIEEWKKKQMELAKNQPETIIQTRTNREAEKENAV
jgi:hypothetical protein